MGPQSSSHKVTITPNRWHVRRSSQSVDRSLTRPEAGGFLSQIASTSTSPIFSQGVFPPLVSAPQVVLVHKPLADAQTKINQPHLARVIAKADATTVADAVLATMNDEAVQVLVAPAQSRLQRRV